MTIREKGYHQWEGELQTPKTPWMPIFLSGIRMVFKRKFAKLLFITSCLPFVFFLIVIYISTRPELEMFKDAVKFLTDDRMVFDSIMSNGPTIFLLMLMGIFFGSDLISGDIQSRSFPLYFSRPLERKDYLLGKYAILMFYYLLFTLVPGLVLVLFKVIFTGKILFTPRFIAALILTPVLTSIFLASLTLVISSLSGNSKYSRIMLILLFYMATPVTAILSHAFSGQYFFLFGPTSTIKQMSSFLFDAKLAFKYPGWLSLALIVLVSIGSYFFLHRRIGKLEAQIESGN